MLNRTLAQLATIGQQIYDDWACSDGRGRCIFIATEWAKHLTSLGHYATPMGVDNPHTTCWVAIGQKVYDLDLPAGYYEHIVAGQWTKFPNVVILPEWIVVTPIRGADRRGFLRERDNATVV